MGYQKNIYYKCQASYIKKAVSQGQTLQLAYTYSCIWNNMVKLGCGYSKEVEEKCWLYCPLSLKDEYKRIFKNPTSLKHLFPD
jgi:hypothetical protein